MAERNGSHPCWFHVVCCREADQGGHHWLLVADKNSELSLAKDGWPSPDWGTLSAAASVELSSDCTDLAAVPFSEPAGLQSVRQESNKVGRELHLFPHRIGGDLRAGAVPSVTAVERASSGISCDGPADQLGACWNGLTGGGCARMAPRMGSKAAVTPFLHSRHT